MIDARQTRKIYIVGTKLYIHSPDKEWTHNFYIGRSGMHRHKDHLRHRLPTRHTGITEAMSGNFYDPLLYNGGTTCPNSAHCQDIFYSTVKQSTSKETALFDTCMHLS